MLFRKDDAWMDELPMPDVRDWPVVDTDGNFIGFVEEVSVDRNEKKLEAVITGPNERFRADDLEFGDHVITVKHSVQWRVPAHDDGATTFDNFDDAFSDHYKRVYSESGESFGQMAAAYRFGRRMAGDADYLGLRFEEAEEGLRAIYSVEGHRPTYGRAREAIRFAYSLARGGVVSEGEGLERVDQQILHPGHHSIEDAVTLGEMMAMGDPELGQRVH